MFTLLNYEFYILYFVITKYKDTNSFKEKVVFDMKNNSLMLILISILMVGLSSCSKKESTSSTSKESPEKQNAVSKPVDPNGTKNNSAQVFVQVKNEKHFNELIETHKNDLVIIDFYADWCQPCRILSPILEDIAKNSPKNARFFKVDVDKIPALSSKFQIKGIPHVVFMKNKVTVKAVTGLRDKNFYTNQIKELL